MEQNVQGGMENLSLDQGGGDGGEVKVNEEGIEYVKVKGSYHPPLADGKYDAIVLSTGELTSLRSALHARGRILRL